MPRARANGIEIEYDTFGDPAAEPLLLIMGLGAQMIFWHEDFCAELAARGHHVLRFDNRDVGLSTKLSSAGVPSIFQMLIDLQQGNPLCAPYTLDEMAGDAVGLLDALSVGRAHVCGASMGGMIAQAVAIRHPERVKSLTSIMSSTGEPGLPPATPEAMALLTTAAPAERAAFLEHAIRLWRTIGSTGFPFDEAEIRTRAGRAFDRCFYPQGQARQLAAILAHGSRREGLETVNLPALVIHGADDPLVPVECGRATARAIRGAELMIIEGMGHDLPRPAWPRIIDAITSLAKRSVS